LQVREVARPAAAAGEVLVRVQAVGLDRGALHIMTGRPYLMRLAGFGVRRPKDPSLGTELAGMIEAVGAEVSGLAVGDDVTGPVGTRSPSTPRPARIGWPESRQTSVTSRPPPCRSPV
jgi:NADPH:quinone reductase-like Zn-dependent oxidoreductase